MLVELELLVVAAAVVEVEVVCGIVVVDVYSIMKQQINKWLVSALIKYSCKKVEILSCI